MKRPLFIICAGSTLFLLGFVALRLTTKNEPLRERPSEGQMERIQETLDTFAQVKTRPLSTNEFIQSLRAKAEASLSSMSDTEREKLLGCIERFYACYSSGDFDAFKSFRMHPPFTLSPALVSAVQSSRDAAASEEGILRSAWEKFNGTNRICQVDDLNISLTVTTRQDLGEDLRKPTSSALKLPGLGASCWEGAVVYQPTPGELLDKQGTLRLFVLEVVVRFNHVTNQPATPLVLMGYWDPTREDWMPLCLCTAFRVGGYGTIF